MYRTLVIFDNPSKEIFPCDRSFNYPTLCNWDPDLITNNTRHSKFILIFRLVDQIVPHFMSKSSAETIVSQVNGGLVFKFKDDSILGEKGKDLYVQWSLLLDHALTPPKINALVSTTLMAIAKNQQQVSVFNQVMEDYNRQ